MEQMEADGSFSRFLKRQDIATETITVLVKEGITDKETFLLLGECHMDVLLNKLPIGEHAKLVKAKKGS